MNRKIITYSEKKIRQGIDFIYRELNQLTRGGLGILIESIRAYTRMSSAQAAAGMTFYAVFSLFPLLAVAVSITSLFIPEGDIGDFLLNFLTPVFPVSRALIDQNIDRFVNQRGAFSVLGGIGLFWSASNVFVILTDNINKAWENARGRNFLQRRLVAFSFLGLILALMAFSMLLTNIYDVVVQIEPPILKEWLSQRSPLLQILPRLVTIWSTFLIFLFLYRYIPTTPVRFSEAFWGALAVTMGWEITSTLFTLYLGSGLARYDLLYGSIAAIAVLMVWLYLNNMMILFGAHLSASVSRDKARQNNRITVGIND